MIHVVSTQKEGEKDAAVSKVHILHHPKQKDDTATNTQTTKIRSIQHIQNSNFRFKSRKNRTRGSERCEKDRTAIKLLILRLFGTAGHALSNGAVMRAGFVFFCVFFVFFLCFFCVFFVFFLCFFVFFLCFFCVFFVFFFVFFLCFFLCFFVFFCVFFVFFCVFCVFFVFFVFFWDFLGFFGIFRDFFGFFWIFSLFYVCVWIVFSRSMELHGMSVTMKTRTPTTEYRVKTCCAAVYCYFL
jgi:hypothetical protein